ncbi:hypothetical protein O9G_004524 [Rozella allomycis CSF55]|uniref:Uncharacterized protein n=1 Tax=Rozella allomycis (strain CSF55) TaxID=988480 RepID=A0A075B1T7_ROZAC|nr:hypothetical protein O9G_004524 [Rozella allomycis CSF55]|eukprot:EPZ34758.1 hypothetical protein O9G_004524 [Rozella allomycis CSF55]
MQLNSELQSETESELQSTFESHSTAESRLNSEEQKIFDNIISSLKTASHYAKINPDRREFLDAVLDVIELRFSHMINKDLSSRINAQEAIDK